MKSAPYSSTVPFVQPTAQTCLPPIPSGPSSPPFRPGHRQPDDPEQKAFLPHLEKQSQYEGSCGGSHFGFPAGRGGHCPPEERAAVGGRTTESRASRVLSSRPRSYSSSLSGPLPLPQDGGGGGGGGGGAGREKVVYPSPRRSVERLSASSSSASAMGPCAPASLSSAPAECPNCKRERKIREEYDKFIVQARRDRDSLNQRVAELEEEEEAMEISRCNTAEIPVNAEEQTPGSAESPQDMESLREDVESLRDDPTREETRGEAVSSTLNGKRLLQLEKESNQLKGQILALQRELEVSREQLDQSAAREKLRSERLHGEQAKAAQDTQGLQTQLNQARQQTESLLSELRSSKAEHERFKENVALTVAQLQKDKDDLMSNLDEVRECYEKVKSENAVLSERVETLKREANHGLHGNSGPSHVHTVTTNTEMLVVSHHVSQQCSGGVNTDSKCCYTSCSGFQERPVPPSPEKPPEDRTEQEPSPLRTEPPEDPENGTEQEPSLLKTKDAFKQLRREHSLLLDVMLVLYKREWFAQEAVPYVRRTLSKCGMKVDEMN
ncbi:coiled-coil domain-containing protein 6-like [Clupea harengus]|uniref:Coiled-coil domain-containing protein 6-like n=1 Tax=Clupea harengus TaxID=7950 RepID=A0A8M1K9K2_CLUHA|nr:coiled-coil domain-containing protein 6-like [Clupea harengus]